MRSHSNGLVSTPVDDGTRIWAPDLASWCYVKPCGGALAVFYYFVEAGEVCESNYGEPIEDDLTLDEAVECAMELLGVLA